MLETFTGVVVANRGEIARRVIRTSRRLGLRTVAVFTAADKDALLTNLARQFAVYSTGRGVSFADRDEIAAVVVATNKHGGGVRTLLNELVVSQLFRTR